MPITKERLQAITNAGISWMQWGLAQRQALKHIHDATIIQGLSPQDALRQIGDLLLINTMPSHEEAAVLYTERQFQRLTHARNERTKRHIARTRATYGQPSPGATPITREQQSSLAQALAKERELRALRTEEPPKDFPEAPEDAPQTAEDTVLDL